MTLVNDSTTLPAEPTVAAQHSETERLRERFSNALLGETALRGHTLLTVAASDLLVVKRELRKDLEFDHITNLTQTD